MSGPPMPGRPRKAADERIADALERIATVFERMDKREAEYELQRKATASE
jgi:hypothetical protein